MFFYGLFRFGRMVARSGARSAPKRPPASPAVTAVAWAIVGLIVLACFSYWLLALVIGAVWLLIAMLSAWDRKPARSAADPLDAVMREVLAKYDDNGRRKP